MFTQLSLISLFFCIQTESRWIRSRKKSLFGHFSHNESDWRAGLFQWPPWLGVDPFEKTGDLREMRELTSRWDDNSVFQIRSRGNPLPLPPITQVKGNEQFCLGVNFLLGGGNVWGGVILTIQTFFKAKNLKSSKY